MVSINKNLEGVEESGEFELLQPGWYEAKIYNSEVKEGPKGEYIKWTFVVDKGDDSPDARVWDIMSLGHPVGLSRLKSLLVACGHDDPNNLKDTEDIHGKNVNIRVKIEKDPEGRYDDKNVVKGFKKIDYEKTDKKSDLHGKLDEVWG